jgi:hypothetical protein
VGHTLLLCGIGLDVDDVPDVVVDEEDRQFYRAVLCRRLASASDNSSTPQDLKPRLNMWRVRAQVPTQPRFRGSQSL